MLVNDIKKGAKLVMRGTGWNATMADNKKGVIRMCEVEGICKEIGSVYVWDIVSVQNPATGVWERVELSEAQLKQKSVVKGFGF